MGHFFSNRAYNILRFISTRRVIIQLVASDRLSERLRFMNQLADPRSRVSSQEAKTKSRKESEEE